MSIKLKVVTGAWKFNLFNIRYQKGIKICVVWLFSNNDPNSSSSSSSFLNDAGGDIQIERVDLYTS